MTRNRMVLATWAVVTPAVLITVQPSARADVDLKTWTAGMDSTWNVDANWAPWGVPNNAGGVEYEAFVDDGHIVSLDLSATVTMLSLINQSQLWIGNGKTLTLWGATTDPGGANVYNQGTLRIYAQGTGTRIYINQGPVTFSSTEGGEMVMEAGTGAGYSEIYGSGATTSARLINEAGHTIRGAGFFRNTLNITNSGLISADVPGEAIEIIAPSMTAGGDCTNDGTLRAEGGATLKLLRTSLTVVSQYVNTDGVIEALDGSSVEIDGRARVTGGELTTAGSGVIRVLDDFGLLRDLTNSGTLRIDPGAQVDIAGTIDNTGTIWVDTLAPGGGGGMRLTTEGDATLTGGGTIDLGDNVNNRIYSTVTTRLLTNVDNTIRGGGDIGNGDMSIINQGVVEASGTTDVMRLWAQSSGTFTNEGVLHAMTAPGMEIWGPFTTSGQVTVDAGSTLAREGTYQQTGGVTAVNGTMSVVCCGGAVDALELDGGSLTGTGTITAIVSNTGGSVEPGNSAGILSITGPYTQGAAGSMTIELGGTIAGIGHDQLAVTGDVSLDGTLEVVLVGSYQPGPADEFTIVTSGGSLDGTFAEVSPGSGFTVTYLADAVVLGGFQPCLADCGSPSSGAVDVTDLLALLAQWGGPGACDIDESGAINVTDLLALLAQWGACP